MNWRESLREIIRNMEKEREELNKIVEGLKTKGINPDIIADESYNIKKAIEALKKIV